MGRAAHCPQPPEGLTPGQRGSSGEDMGGGPHASSEVLAHDTDGEGYQSLGHLCLASVVPWYFSRGHLGLDQEDTVEVLMLHRPAHPEVSFDH